MTGRLFLLVEECPDGPRDRRAPPVSPVPAAREAREKPPDEREEELLDELKELREDELLEDELLELELLELELLELELLELELLELELWPLGGMVLPVPFFK